MDWLLDFEEQELKPSVGTRSPLELFNAIAPRYAELTDTRPHHVYYERPATISLLPSVMGKRVLDIGCGPGWYSQWLIEHGASSVTGIDFSPRMLKTARERLGSQANLLQADLTRGLSFLNAQCCELILCPLVLHYVKDWDHLFLEFSDKLVSGGHIVFSTFHPMDVHKFKPKRYFNVEMVEDEWDDFGRMVFYRRSLSSMFDSILKNHFEIERVLEPKPLPEFAFVDPARYKKFSTYPKFIMIRARRR